MNFFIFYEFFKNVINKKKSKKFLHCIALDKYWIVKRGDKISYWHKLKSFVPLSGNLLVLCLLLRPEIDRITSLLAFQIIRTIRDCTFVFFFAVISNFLLWYVYDFPIFLDPKILSVICICFGCYYFKNTWSGLFFSFFLTFQESVYFSNCWEYYQLFIKIMLKNQQVTTWLDYKLLFYITIILQIKLHNYTIIDNFLKWNF